MSTGVGPCVTHGQIVSRLGTRSPRFAIPVTETQISDQSPAQIISDPVSLSPEIVLPNGDYAFIGTEVQVATATIGTYTTRNTAASVPDKITANGQSGSYWSTACGGTCVGMFVQDTTAGAYFYVDQDLGTATAQITRPVQQCSASNLFPDVVTIANGDALVVSRYTKTNVSVLSSDWYNSINTPYVTHVLLTGGTPGGPTGFTGAQLGIFSAIEVSSDSAEFVSPTEFPTAGTFYCNPYFQGLSIFNNSTIYAGAIRGFPEFTAQNGTGPSLSQGVLIEPSAEWHMTGSNQIFDAYLSLGPDTDGCYGGTITIGNYDDGSGVLWGPASWDNHDRCRLECAGGCTANLQITGSLTVHGQTTAFPWVASTHAYGAAVTITPANIDSNGGLFDPRTGDGFMNHP